jgi:hypothetical protein
LDDAERVRVVVVRSEQNIENHAHRRDDQCGEKRPPERVDLERVVEQVGGELQHERVEGKDEDEADRDHEREAQGGQQRRKHSVQRANDCGNEQRTQCVVDVNARKDRRRDPERRRRDRPGEQQPIPLEAHRLRLPGRRVPVLCHQPAVRFVARFAARCSARCSFCSETFTFASS